MYWREREKPKLVRARRWKYNTAVGLQPQYIEYAKRGKPYNNMLSYLIHAKIIKNINMRREVLTIVGEGAGLSTRPTKSIGKEHL